VIIFHNITVVTVLLYNITVIFDQMSLGKHTILLSKTLKKNYLFSLVI